VNSLRLVGHRETIHVLDCGLTSEQRELLGAEADLVAAPEELPPYLLKTVAPLRHPADVRVLIDADMIVIRPLTDLVSAAAKGAVVAFRNDRERFVPEWGQLLELGVASPRPYVSSALVILGGRTGDEILRLLDDRQRRIDFERGFARRSEHDYPFLYPEQDVLNAILCTRGDGARIVALDERLAAKPPFRGLRLHDPTTLRCSYRGGSEPYVLHHYFRKPWLSRMRSNVYSRLLTRLLCGPDVPLRPDPATLPLRLRHGPAAAVARKAVDVGVGAPAALRRRLRRRPERIAAWPDARPSPGPHR
jgi:hypothetical protein